VRFSAIPAALTARKLAGGAAEHFYRIAQEALSNACPGEASEVGIMLECRAEELELCIADNGRGMAAPDPTAPSVFGSWRTARR
jgi:signal transduction histidine kinase